MGLGMPNLGPHPPGILKPIMHGEAWTFASSVKALPSRRGIGTLEKQQAGTGPRERCRSRPTNSWATADQEEAFSQNP